MRLLVSRLFLCKTGPIVLARVGGGKSRTKAQGTACGAARAGRNGLVSTLGIGFSRATWKFLQRPYHLTEARWWKACLDHNTCLLHESRVLCLGSVPPPAHVGSLERVLPSPGAVLIGLLCLLLVLCTVTGRLAAQPMVKLAIEADDFIAFLALVSRVATKRVPADRFSCSLSP